MHHAGGRWELFVDTGGTFTDCIALAPSGDAHRLKVLSSGVVRAVVRRVLARDVVETHPLRGVAAELLPGWRASLAIGGPKRTVTHADGRTWRFTFDAALAHGELRAGDVLDFSTGEEAPVLAARLLTKTRLGEALPAMAMRLATTRGTNALLEKRGAPAALFVTKGFRDLLRVGDQSRLDLFAIDIVKREPVTELVVEVDERLDAEGRVLRPLDGEAAVREAKRLLASGVRSAAIALLHSYLNPAHEQMLARLLREAGFEHVSMSSELAPLIRILPRAQTSAVDAALSPIVSAYVGRVQEALGAGEVRLLTSAGGLARAPEFRAKDGLLSGPAGGVVGAMAAARWCGFSRIIGFDMGGTSTDVARIDGEPMYRSEHEVAGVRVFAPALAIETVAAGGGSICDFLQDVLTVGPASAGANPGPACYGAGGPLTLTDVNLLLGKLEPAMFEIPISLEAAERALDVVRERIGERTGTKPERRALLEGFLAIANQRMANGISRVSVRDGYDPAAYALVAFGGAGAQHACAVADLLGMRTIIMPAEASLLSAVGLAHAAAERFAQRQALERLEACAAKLEAMFAELLDDASAQLASEMHGDGGVTARRFADLRLAGQETAITIELAESELRESAAAAIASKFADAYAAMYGHAPAGKPIEVAALRVTVASHAEAGEQMASGLAREPAKRFVKQRELRGGDRVTGGDVITGASTCCVVGEGWSGVVDAAGTIVLTREAEIAARAALTPAIAQDALIAQRLVAIAESMGEQLRRTAVSTNVKERLDFSCAVLDADGALVASAAHIPVHLGALGHCVRAVMSLWRERGLAFRAGDVVVTNHPAFGGSHLPDVTVVTPVFAAGGERIGFAASRAHHADIGGRRPGSMPADATRLAEEGVVIEPTLLVDAGAERFDAIEAMLRGGAFPSRAVSDNVADLRAAVAANHRGASLLKALAEEIGIPSLRSHMRAVLERSERLVREALERTCDAEHQHAAMERTASDAMDDGSAICVRVAMQRNGGARGEGAMLTIDFTGTAAAHAGNLNATPAIVHSAVMYVMRLIVAEAVPLNDGLLRPVNIVLPPCMLNPAFAKDAAHSPAVVGGNTETSQRVVDVLLRAFGVAAASQGTMNNVLFGTDTWAYYETICGGAGASARAPGADAVHTHMTNTRMTDAELLEKRYPVRLERFAIRRGSGGRGAHHGGDGVIREFTFLAPMQLSVLTQRRTVAPRGVAGGGGGLPGAQRVVRASGDIVPLQSVDQCDVGAGDRLIIETPGGGAWGADAG